MSTNIQTVLGRGRQLFDKRSALLSMWQEIAENVYPERADFTTVRNLGAEFADNLMTSYPVVARRDLGNAFGAMLRPTAKEWFKLSVQNADKLGVEARQWLEWMGGFQRRAMYDRHASLTRATKEGDHDFAAFGQCVISVEMREDRTGLLYRNWHLRDVVWFEDAAGFVGGVFRRWNAPANVLHSLFGKDRLHSDICKCLEKDPYKEFEFWHAVMRAEEYQELPGARKIRQPWVSIWIDVAHQQEVVCDGAHVNPYVIPRWQTVSGSQYAHSPAVVAALPDARLLQSMTLTLLEAGEKVANPPLLAVKNAIRSDLAVYAGGVTWVDQDYDERMGEVLRPMTTDAKGLSFNVEVIRDIRLQLADAFYLSKLNLPPTGGPDMTAYEVGQRVQEFIRNTLPLFEPLEYEYNGQLCDATLELLLATVPQLRRSVPRELAHAETHFEFESPLTEAISKAKANQFVEAQQVLATAAQLDPSVVHLLDGKKATQDVLDAITPAAWLRPDAEVDERVRAAQAQQAAASQLAMLQQGAEVAKTLGEARPATAGLGADVVPFARRPAA